MQEVELPHGVVKLREPDEVTEAGSRGMTRASLVLPGERRQEFADAQGDEEATKALLLTFGADDLDAQKAISDASILAFVISWTYPQALTVAGLGELPRTDYDALEKIVTKLTEQLRPDLTPSDDPDSPT